MKSNFEECMARLLEHEGGYVNHAEDPGGETNLGVTRAVYEQYVGRQVMDGEMEGLTHDDVYPIYKENYWDRVRGDDLPSGVDPVRAPPAGRDVLRRSSGHAGSSGRLHLRNIPGAGRIGIAHVAAFNNQGHAARRA